MPKRAVIFARRSEHLTGRIEVTAENPAGAITVPESSGELVSITEAIENDWVVVSQRYAAPGSIQSAWVVAERSNKIGTVNSGNNLM